MSRSKTRRLKKAQRDIDLTATNLANKQAREFFLSSPKLAQRLIGVTNKNMTILKRSWAPFQPDYSARSGFGMKLHINDPLVRQLLQEEGLYDIAEEIATDAIKRSIMINQRTFITTMLEDLILRPTEESFYGPAKAWPGDTSDRHLGSTYI